MHSVNRAQLEMEPAALDLSLGRRGSSLALAGPTRTMGQLRVGFFKDFKSSDTLLIEGGQPARVAVLVGGRLSQARHKSAASMLSLFITVQASTGELRCCMVANPRIGPANSQMEYGFFALERKVVISSVRSRECRLCISIRASRTSGSLKAMAGKSAGNSLLVIITRFQTK